MPANCDLHPSLSRVMVHFYFEAQYQPMKGLVVNCNASNMDVTTKNPSILKHGFFFYCLTKRSVDYNPPLNPEVMFTNVCNRSQWPWPLENDSQNRISSYWNTGVSNMETENPQNNRPGRWLYRNLRIFHHIVPEILHSQKDVARTPRRHKTKQHWNKQGKLNTTL